MAIRAEPQCEAAEVALKIYEEVLEAVRGDRLVRSALDCNSGVLFVQGNPYELHRFQRIKVVAVGKAAIPMARETAAILGPSFGSGIVVAPQDSVEPIEGYEVLGASHPIPDETSIAAGRRVFEFASHCDEHDFVLFLLSGGASSLMDFPCGDVTLEDLRTTTDFLLASGIPINEVNAVRARISRIKGGGLARAFSPATVVCLVLSDVVSGEISAVGSGPLLPPQRSYRFPYSLLDGLPQSVRSEVLAHDLVPVETPRVDHYVIGSVSVAVHAAADAARALGFDPLPYGDPLSGEAREMSRRILTVAGRHVSARPTDRFCMIFGGETTVTLRGHGTGGRCQEMTVAALPQLSRLPDTAFLAAGTDGRDGPTDAAGGLACTATLSCARAAGLDSRRALVENDSGTLLSACHGLIFTGPTGSNVNDLCLVVHAPPKPP